MNATAVLTRREAEIAELIAWGATKKDVANILNRSPRTIENIARSVYEKTGVTKVNELSAWYFCTHFNISLTLSPLIRRTLATLLLIVFCASMSTEANKLYLRFRRVEEIRERPRRDDDFLIII